MRRFGLSKSKLTAFEQCPKRLWLQVHRPELGEEEEAREARLAVGHSVGDEACRQRPGGVMVRAMPNLGAALANTAELLAAQPPRPIFEATIEHDGVLVRCDLLEPDGAGGWAMAEVKSTGGVKDYHRGDLATQLWVARAAGVPVSRAAIRHLDTGFVLEREGDWRGVFADTDLTDELADEVAGRAALVAEARAVLAGPEPEQRMGSHCATPFGCEFTDHCHRDLPPGPEWPVTVLPYGGGAKWLQQGVDDLFAVDPARLSATARRVHGATVTGQPDHDPAGAAIAMAGWTHPRIWLDFETIGFALPRWLGTRPFEQVPFQFTAIVEDGDGGETLHEFLHLHRSDPRRACAEALLRLPDKGAVIAYNASFEERVIRALARDFPDLAAGLAALADRVVDLLPVTRAHWYHRDQRGSWSIKAVLPTLAPAMSYAALGVKDGGDAQAAYLEAIAPETSAHRRAALDAALRIYCGRDVEAMRVVARRLLGEG